MGQVQDYTALAVVEACEWEDRGERDGVTFEFRRRTTVDVRRVERLALGTSYPAVARRVRALGAQLVGSVVEGWVPGRPAAVELVVDATGVGAAVVDLVGRVEGCCLVAVVISSGSGALKKSADWWAERWTVPKADLVGCLAVGLQERRVRVAAAVPEADGLARELLAMGSRVGEAGRVSYGGRDGVHDDMVMAVALAVWRVGVPLSRRGFGRFPVPPY